MISNGSHKCIELLFWKKVDSDNADKLIQVWWGDGDK